MKLIDILTGINPILKILLIIVLTVAAHFTVADYASWMITVNYQVE